LVLALAIYWKLSVRSYIKIRSDLTFLLLYIVQCLGVYFFTGHSVFVLFPKGSEHDHSVYGMTPLNGVGKGT